ncbi:hypothetical protein CKA32_002505 [Geitlerinema sp. FC II]|nr:hypothetical protein [Geitlerinema sp. CS-897]PPT06323.1 hypothetical protein CKA32_002505 [Geitlerinema sp. FC II]
MSTVFLENKNTIYGVVFDTLLKAASRNRDASQKARACGSLDTL